MEVLNIREIPVDARSKHKPPPLGGDLMPVHEFTMGVIAPKGSGKTNTIVDMLRIYAGYFHNVYVFSPSVKTDEKWRYAKKMKVRVENKELKAWVVKMNEQHETEDPVQPLPGGKEFDGLADTPFTEEIPEECFFDVNDFDEFTRLLEKKKKMIEALYDHDQFKTLADRDLFIIDDAVGSPFFTGKRLDFFKNVNTRHRHYSASFIMATQGYKEIPKTVRTNWTCLMVYEIGNVREIFVIYEEFPVGKTWDDWFAMYKHATKELYSFLFIDMYGPKEKRVRRNFNHPLSPAVSQTTNDQEPGGGVPEGGPPPTKKLRVL